MGVNQLLIWPQITNNKAEKQNKKLTHTPVYHQDKKKMRFFFVCFFFFLYFGLVNIRSVIHDFTHYLFPL